MTVRELIAQLEKAGLDREVFVYDEDVGCSYPPRVIADLNLSGIVIVAPDTALPYFGKEPEEE